MDRKCPSCSTVIRYFSGSELSLGACPACNRLMLFPASPASSRKMLRDLAGPQPVMIGPDALHRRHWWRAVLTLSLGIVLAWTLSALYATGLIRMLGVEVPLWQTPDLFLPFCLVSLIFTAGIVWLAISGNDRGRLGQLCFYVISGVAAGVVVDYGIRMLSRYRNAIKLHRQLA